MARSHLLRTTSSSGLQLVVLLCRVCASLGQYYQYPINEITIEEAGVVEPLAPETRSSRCYNELGQAQVGALIHVSLRLRGASWAVPEVPGAASQARLY